MADEKPKAPDESRHTLTDDQITTERTLRRRSFLTAAGALVAGGAVAVALGGGADALAQSTDPDRVRDPDKVREPDKVRDPHRVREPDRMKEPDKVRDPDKLRHLREPDRRKHIHHEPDRPKPPNPDP